MSGLSAKSIRVIGLAGVLSALAASALAQTGTPRSMAECERLKNDLAYNQCLAMFGPEAKTLAGGGDGAGGKAAFASPPSSPSSDTSSSALADIPNAEEPTLAEPYRRGRRSRGGARQSASFEVNGGEVAVRRAPRRWSRRR